MKLHRQRARARRRPRSSTRSTAPAGSSPRCAARRSRRCSHKEAGVDIIIAQGTEGGGHTGDVGSSVLWPEVIDAVAPTPVLAAGGIGNGRQMAAALAIGAQGVWTGTLWLTVEEADIPPAQMDSYLAATSRDTVRSRSYTGKPCRMLRNDWTDAWERPTPPSRSACRCSSWSRPPRCSRGHRVSGTGEDGELQPRGPGHRAGHQGPRRRRT